VSSGRGYEYRVFPEEVTIENFKSIRRITLRLRPGINVLVGPNGAGKTNILEAVYFFAKALSALELLKVPYAPHIPLYWSPEDVFYGRRTENPLGFEVLLRVTRGSGGEYVKHYVRFSTKFTVSPDRSTVGPTYISVDWGSSKLELDSGEARVYINSDYIDEYLEVLRSAEREVGRGFRGLLRKFERLTKLKETTGTGEGGRYLLFDTQSVKEMELLLFPPIFTESSVAKDELTELCIVSSLPLPSMRIPILLKWGPANREEFKGMPQPTLGKYIVGMIGMWFEKVILLKHPDIGAISEPQAFTSGDRLDVRARNLSQVIYKLLAERDPRFLKFVDESLRRLFGEVSVEPRSSAGRVFLVINERGLELPPPNVADGIIKVLAIAAAVALGPFILLIDEVENSLHAKALEYVFDFLNNLEVPVVVATHSPVVVDLAGPERTMVVSRKPPDYSTTVEYFERAEELRRRLSELGVSFADYIFYEKTRPEGGT
jgi:energy-coupling factor transporter ATP-binding protein EcfA2